MGSFGDIERPFKWARSGPQHLKRPGRVGNPLGSRNVDEAWRAISSFPIGDAIPPPPAARASSAGQRPQAIICRLFPRSHRSTPQGSDALSAFPAPAQMTKGRRAPSGTPPFFRTLLCLLAGAPSTAAAAGAAGAAFAAVAGLDRCRRASARGVLTLTGALIRLFHRRSPVLRRAQLPALTETTQGAPPHYTLRTSAWQMLG